jgi:glycosyltransferase involved in cell wall biosynthesis
MAEAASYLPAARFAILSLAARSRYDIHHTHFILPDGWNAAGVKRARGLPYVITAHGSDVPGYNPHRLRLAHRLLAPIWRRVVRGASSLVCPSRVLAELVARQLPNIRTEVIPYGFDLGRYAWDAPRRQRILVVSRLLERKGVQDLIEAVAGERLDHEVHIVGEGPHRESLERLARASATPIRFHGWLDNRSDALRELYETSQIFVLPSEAENFPVVLMEAMAAGLAIVTTRGTGCAEVVGETGVLVRPHDAGEIRSALAALTRDPSRCRALGQLARERIEREMAWPAVATRYLDLYRRHRGHGPSAV